MTLLLAALLVVAAKSVNALEDKCSDEKKVNECSKQCGPFQRDEQGDLKYDDITDERGIELYVGMMMLSEYLPTWKEINCSSFRGSELSAYEKNRSKMLMDNLRNNDPQLLPCPKNNESAADWCTCPKGVGYDCYDVIECIIRKHSAINGMVDWSCDDRVCDPAKYPCPANYVELALAIVTAIKKLDKKKSEAENDELSPIDAYFLELLMHHKNKDGNTVLDFSAMREFKLMNDTMLAVVKDNDTIFNTFTQQRKASAKFEADCVEKKKSEQANKPVLCIARGPEEMSAGQPMLSSATVILAFLLGIYALVW